jgi:RNA polymerase sigma-70 factor (ECF subfamily)
MAESMDAEQLSMWYDSYGDRLMLYARNWLPEDSAQDIVQGAFIRLMSRSLAPRDAQAWLFRTVRNEAVTRLRRQERQRRHGRQIAMQRVGWFESHPEDLIDARTAQDVLMTLPQPQREVVLLRIWGQLSLKQIARIVGNPLTTVHSRYKAALAAIKERMQQSCRTTAD